MSAPIWFDSTEAGAPTLNNAAGSLISLLRAVLINGFNVKAITSISVTSGVATVTCPAHGFSSAYGKWLKVSGASVPALDGVKQQTIVDANTFTYPAPGVADGSYTATDARRAPLGWTEEYVDGGATKAIYKRSAPDALVAMLRVDDSGGASMARALGVMSATGVDSYGADFFPSEAQVSGGAYWQKGTNSAAAKVWHLVGDSLGFYLAVQLGASSEFVVYWFGDPTPFYAADTGFTVLSAQTSATVLATPAWQLGNSVSAQAVPGSSGIFSPKGVIPAESSPVTQTMCGTEGTNALSGSSSFPNAAVYLNPVLHPLVYVVSAGPCIRGQMPGLAYVLSSAPFASGVPAVAGSDTYLPISINVSGSIGQLALKLGGWR